MIGLKQFELGTIAPNFAIYHCAKKKKKKIPKFKQQWNFLSDIHQNLVITSLYFDKAKCKISYNSTH